MNPNHPLSACTPPLRFRPRKRPPPPEPTPRLVFSPAAWLKLMFFLHGGDHEVGGFGISSGHDPLYIEQFVTVSQTVSSVSVQFDDAAVADYFDRCVDAGLKPERCGRVWVHTHPADSPDPSCTDEETFRRVFGSCHWAVMFIVSRTAKTYARLSLRIGPGAQVLLEVAVDWDAWPKLVLEQSCPTFEQMLNWAQEFEQNVRPARSLPASGAIFEDPFGWSEWWDIEEYQPTEASPSPGSVAEANGEVSA
jgi:hypothetical protein